MLDSNDHTRQDLFYRYLFESYKLNRAMDVLPSLMPSRMYVPYHEREPFHASVRRTR